MWLKRVNTHIVLKKKKENYKIHAFAKWGGKHYSKNHQVALEWTEC